MRKPLLRNHLTLIAVLGGAAFEPAQKNFQDEADQVGVVTKNHAIILRNFLSFVALAWFVVNGYSQTMLDLSWQKAHTTILSDCPGEKFGTAIATGDLRWPTTAEQWGNVTVKVEQATLVELNPTNYDLMAIDDGSGRILVDDDSDSLSAYILPPAGSVFDEVRGWVYHHYGSYDDSSTYKLEPLYTYDLVLNTEAVDQAVVPEGYALGNYPNPFNPTTRISFRIPEDQAVRLVIYNQLGQVVNTLLDQPLTAGEYQLVWRGLNQAGKPVASGLYFYRLLAGDQQLVRKMTYLK